MWSYVIVCACYQRALWIWSELAPHWHPASSGAFRAVVTLKLVSVWQKAWMRFTPNWSGFSSPRFSVQSFMGCLVLIKKKSLKKNKHHWFKFCFFQMKTPAVLVVLLSNLYFFLKHSISKINILHHIIDIFTCIDAFRMLFFPGCPLSCVSLFWPVSCEWCCW